MPGPKSCDETLRVDRIAVTGNLAMPICDVCGSAAVQEIRCKMICRNCGTILQSCADLTEPAPGAPTAAAAR